MGGGGGGYALTLPRVILTWTKMWLLVISTNFCDTLLEFTADIALGKN